MKDEKVLSIYGVVYNKLDELNQIKVTEETTPEMVLAVSESISILADILWRSKESKAVTK